MLGLIGGTAAGLLLAGCGSEGSGKGGASAAPGTTAGGAPEAESARGIVFNTASRDVTLFDPVETG